MSLHFCFIRISVEKTSQYLAEETVKIYTFNAPIDTKVELLWPLRSINRDLAFEKLIAQTHWTEVDSLSNCDVAIFHKKAFDPENLAFEESVFEAVKEANNYGKPLIIDATCDSDEPLEIPGTTILRFGLYQSLKQNYEHECPYWINHKTKAKLESLPIHPRSPKPSVGFCGTTSAAGKYFTIAKTLPARIAQTVLSKGSLARKFDIRLKKGMSHKLREKAIEYLSSDPRIDDRFDITNTLQDYYNPSNHNRGLLEIKFVENLRSSDYALCVRANGNYSGRFYMALNAGRIPLVIDTDQVFPFESQIHMVRIPVNSLKNISDLVLNHFETTSDRELIDMKKENRAAYNNLMAPDRYIPNFLENIANSVSVRSSEVGYRVGNDSIGIAQIVDRQLGR